MGDLLALSAIAAMAQLVFPERIDLAAHLVAGAGLALAFSAFAPSRARPWIAAGSVGACLVLAVVVELVQPGVMDLGDVAYTGAGSLLVARSTVVVARADRRWRLATALLGAAMIAVGLVLRYGR